MRFRVLTDVTVQVKEGANRRRRRAEFWSCRVLPPAAITVPAGTFEALEIRCEQFSSRTMRILSEERWYYSEEVGHYVSRKWVDLSSGRRGGSPSWPDARYRGESAAHSKHPVQALIKSLTRAPRVESLKRR